MYDVITVGSATIDVFADSDSELIKIMTNHSEEDLIAYPVGTKILITDIKFLTGGGGTNTAVSFSRLGLKTAYLGKLGNDDNGEMIHRSLKAEGIDFVGARGKIQSGYSIILDSIEDDRTILTYKGANNNLEFSELNTKKLKARWFYFCAMVGKSYKTLEKLASFAKENGVLVAFNPSCYIAEKGVDYLKHILERTDALILNKEEACFIVGRNDPEKLCEHLHDLGPRYVVVTDGKRGAWASDGKKKYFVKPPDVKVKETTGAGDAFGSSFVAGLVKKDDVKFALELATANAISVIMNKGAKNDLLTYRKALNLIRKHKIKARSI